MDDLVRWLGAQLDEDERIARAAEASSEEGWWWGPDSESAAERHIAAHDPARVLREIEAKRDILKQHVDAVRVLRTYADLKDATYSAMEVSVLTKVVRALALPYADRPGYEQATAQ